MQEDGALKPADNKNEEQTIAEDLMPLDDVLRELPQKERAIIGRILAQREISSPICSIVLLANPGVYDRIVARCPEKIPELLDVVIETDKATAALTNAQADATKEFASGNTKAIENESIGMKRGQNTFMAMLVVVSVAAFWLLYVGRYREAVAVLGLVMVAAVFDGLAKLFRGHTPKAESKNDED